jgi:ribosome biogenesis protein YTM1
VAAVVIDQLLSGYTADAAGLRASLPTQLDNHQYTTAHCNCPGVMLCVAICVHAVIGQQVLEEGVLVSEQDGTAAQHTKKKRKTATAEAAGVPMQAVQVQPKAHLSGHIHCVAGVSWPEASTLYSGGWDHSVRRYDVETQANTDTYNGSKAVYAVAAAGHDNSSSSSSLVNSNVVALGGSDKVLRIWDSRAVKGEALAVRAYAAHEGWISSLAWRPSSSFHVASGSHDGTVKLWDIRTAVPLGSLQQHSDAKVLCVGWWGKEVLVSGGADCKLQLYDLP